MRKAMYLMICRSLMRLKYEEREAENIARFLTEDLEKMESSGIAIPTMAELEQRLLAGEPWQYISGRAHFYGMDFTINSTVLIPRMETEELVFHALGFIPKDQPVSVIDIGTGSGIIALTIAKHRPESTVTAIDISKEALSVAIKNQQQLRISNVYFKQLDFLHESSWSELPECDILLSNPPYIPESEKHFMSRSTLQYEPHLALFTKSHPLEFYQSIARFMMSRLSPVRCLVEINEFRGQEVREIFVKAGLAGVEIIQDMQGKDRLATASNGVV